MTNSTLPAEAGEVLSSAVQQVVQQSRMLGHHITRHEEWAAEVQKQIGQAFADARDALDQYCQSALAEVNAQAEARKADLLAQFTGSATSVRQEAASNLAQLQETHRQQVTKIASDGAALLESMRSEIAATLERAAAERERIQTDHREEAESQRRTLNQEHREALENSLETTHHQREEQRREYQQLRQDTIADVNLERERMQSVHKEAGEAQLRTLSREHREALETSLDVVRREREEQRGEYQQLRQQTVTELNGELSQALESSEANFQTAMSTTTANLNADHQRSNDAAVAGINATWTRFTRILIGVTGVSSAIAVAALVMSLL